MSLKNYNQQRKADFKSGKRASYTYTNEQLWQMYLDKRAQLRADGYALDKGQKYDDFLASYWSLSRDRVKNPLNVLLKQDVMMNKRQINRAKKLGYYGLESINRDAEGNLEFENTDRAELFKQLKDQYRDEYLNRDDMFERRQEIKKQIYAEHPGISRQEAEILTTKYIEEVDLKEGFDAAYGWMFWKNSYFY